MLYGSKCLVINGEANTSTIHEIESFERNVAEPPGRRLGLVSPSTRLWDALAAGEPWTSLAWRPPQTLPGPRRDLGAVVPCQYTGHSGVHGVYTRGWRTWDG